MQKFMRSWMVRSFLPVVCLCLFPEIALAGITCPARIGVKVNPASAYDIPPGSAAFAAATAPDGGTSYIVCSYTVKLLAPHYSPRVLSAAIQAQCAQAGNAASPAMCGVCPPFLLEASLPSPDPAPAPGFTPWAFGGPAGTSNSDSVVPIFSGGVIRPSPKTGMPSGSIRPATCSLINNGTFGFAIYSIVPNTTPCTTQGLDNCSVCTASGNSFTCTAPKCPVTLTGGKIPSAAASPTSSSPGYYAYESVIFNANNVSNVLVLQASYGQLKSAMGAAFSGDRFTLINGPNSLTGMGFPASAISCDYDSTTFPYMQKTAEAQIEIVCTTTCSSL